MRSAPGVASILISLCLAGPAAAQDGSVTPAEPVPGAEAANIGSMSHSRIAGRRTAAFAPAQRPVYAIVGERLVSGLSQPEAFSPEGGLVLRDANDPEFLCVGRFRESPHGGPDVRLACSDGRQVEVSTTAFTEDSGFGRARNGAAASLTYGFPARSAARRLVAPAGHVLVAQDGMLVLKRTGA